ncbi:MAG: nitroreductase family protein [Acidimicrobiales bacterium]
MELVDAIRRRKMTRSFSDDPVDADVLNSILSDALRAPSAGFSQGCDLVVLEGLDQTGVFWKATTTPDWRERSLSGSGLHSRLLRVPVVVVCLANPQAYLERYSEPDKAASGLGLAAGIAAWPVPYWIVDASFVAMTILLRCTDEGLGALFFGIFRGAEKLKHELGIPDTMTAIGGIAIGYPGPRNRPSSSIARGRRPFSQVVHRGSW